MTHSLPMSQDGTCPGWCFRFGVPFPNHRPTSIPIGRMLILSHVPFQVLGKLVGASLQDGSPSALAGPLPP